MIVALSSEGPNLQEFYAGQTCESCNKCSGFLEHDWRKSCKDCKCARNLHHVIVDQGSNARSRLGLIPQESEERSREYTWIPALLDDKQVNRYYACFADEDVPRVNTPGELKRKQRLVTQLPKQDLAPAGCRHILADQLASYEEFIQHRNEVALDIGIVQFANDHQTCAGCDKPITVAQPMVIPSRIPQTYWHPNCFRCSDCSDLLVDLAYCESHNKPFCIRHYSDKIKPRCNGCDELIFSAEYTNAMDKDWHGQHFSCWQCDESLTGQRYVLREEHPYCVKCYEGVFANTCEKCNRIIGIDSKDLSYKDKHWHEACFQCTSCNESLVDKQFGAKGEKIYCGKCYDKQFASKCDGCGKIFHAGTKKMEYKNRQWHEQCFKCCKCDTPIGTKSFIPREKEIYCAGCYEEKYATRCFKCEKAIQSGGVTYKNQPWHRECFTCTHCNKNLAGQRFTSRDDKPCCAECFGRLFAKRCTSCAEPITGIGGTRFISFEDRHWHNDCFICATCTTSLVGRGFITDEDKIICPECAKERFM